MVTDEQVVLLMAELKKGRPLATGAAKAGMSQATARKWKGSASCRARAASRARAPTPSNSTGRTSGPSLCAIREGTQRRYLSGCSASNPASTGTVSCARCSSASGDDAWRPGPSGSCSSSRSGSHASTASPNSGT